MRDALKPIGLLALFMAAILFLTWATTRPGKFDTGRFTTEQKVELASTLNLPFTFSSGQVIYASQMNSNFQAIRAVVNALDDQNITNASITGSLKLIDGTVSLAKMGTDSINSSKVVDGSLTTTDILDGTLLVDDLADGSVSSLKILDGTIAPGDLADNAVIEQKIDFANTPTTNFYVAWNGTKLEYRQGPGPTSCSQVLSARGAHVYNNPAPTTFYTSFVQALSATTETGIGNFRSPVNQTFHHLSVTTDAAPPATRPLTFKLHWLGHGDIAPQCTITNPATSCQESATFVGEAANDGFSIVSIEPTGGISTTVNFVAAICISPY